MPGFCQHHGFDWEAIEAAWERYRRGGGRLVGASTISMQTAKNLFLWPGRDWLRKGLEAWFTVWIELSWSKRRIIEVYLNVVELGPGLYGAEAAARHYFGKPAASLTAAEAARLAAVVPDPLDRSARSPGPEARRHAAFILEGDAARAARQSAALRRALRAAVHNPAVETVPCGWLNSAAIYSQQFLASGSN